MWEFRQLPGSRVSSRLTVLLRGPWSLCGQLQLTWTEGWLCSFLSLLRNTHGKARALAVQKNQASRCGSTLLCFVFLKKYLWGWSSVVGTQALGFGFSPEGSKRKVSADVPNCHRLADQEDAGDPTVALILLCSRTQRSCYR